jgi:predicted phosphoribosyltransferase
MTTFYDRNDAAIKLSKALMSYQGQHPLVLGIPRGAVPMAKIIAEKLNGDCDVVLVRKLQAPYSPELAIGSVDESGWAYIASIASAVGADEKYITQEKQIQMDIIRQRRKQYTPVRPPLDPAGRVVIVIDDGLATGATMIAALHSLIERNPAKLICAVPVAPADTFKKITRLADQVVCLEVPEHFQSVGQFYEHFPQVEDAEVISTLQSAQATDNRDTYVV